MRKRHIAFPMPRNYAFGKVKTTDNLKPVDLNLKSIQKNETNNHGDLADSSKAMQMTPMVTGHHRLMRRNTKTGKEDAPRKQRENEDRSATGACIDSCRTGPAKATGLEQSARGVGRACLCSPYPGGYRKSGGLGGEGKGRRRRQPRRPGSVKET
jgi:hypothetical protein